MRSNPPISLRDATKADIPAFFEQQRDPEAMRMAAFTRRDRAEVGPFTAHWMRILGDATMIKKAILLRNPGAEPKVVGSVASWRQGDERHVTYGVAREHWGCGIATAALAALLNEVRERPLHARAARDNVASLRVLEKCGFIITHYERAFAEARGEETEEAVLVLR